MKKQNKRIIETICLVAGAGLMIVAIAILLGWQWRIRSFQQRLEEYVHTLRTLMPEPQGAYPEERRDNTMAVLSLDGTDFIGILEMPVYGSALPVCAQWGNSSKYPCCLRGSIYDGTMQIGATSQKGQYDFYREISVGDTVFYTDMEGNRYSYEVTDIRYERHADQVALQKKEAALTLFVKNEYALEYVIIFCNVIN